MQKVIKKIIFSTPIANFEDMSVIGHGKKCWKQNDLIAT